MTFAKRVGRGLMWNQLSRVVELGSAYLASVLVARALGAVEFGVYSVTLSVVTLSYYATSLGMNEVLNVHVSRLATSPGRVAFLLRALLRLRGVIALFLAAGLGLGAPLIARLWREPALEPLLRVAAVYAFFYNISQVLEYFLIGALDVLRVSRARILVQLLNLAAAFAALTRHWHAGALISVMTLSSALGTAWLVWGARRALRTPGEPFDLGPLRRFGLTLWVTNFVNFFLGRQSDVLMIGFFRPGTHEAGCYSAASLLAGMLASALLMGTEGVSLAAFSDLEQRVDRSALGRLWELHVKMDVLLSLPLLAFGALLSREIIKFLYARSSGFDSAAPMLTVYCGVWAVARILGGGTNMTVLYALNRPRLSLVIYGVTGALNLIVNLMLVPRFGAVGAIAGTGVSLAIASLASSVLVMRWTGARLPFGFALRVALAAGAAALAVHVTPRPIGLAGLAVAATVGLVVCVLALRLLRPLSDDDRRLLIRLNPRFAWLTSRL